MLSIVQSLALVHPGHGTTDPSSLRHYLTEPLHVYVLVGAISLVVCVALWRIAMTSERND